MRRGLILVLVLLGAHVARAAGIDDDASVRTRVYLASKPGQPVRLNLDLPFLLSTRWTIGTPADAFRLEERLSEVPGGISTVQFRLEPGAVAGEELRERLGGSTIRSSVLSPRTYLGQPALPAESLDGDAIGGAETLTYADERGSVRVASRTLSRGWLETPAAPGRSGVKLDHGFPGGGGVRRNSGGLAARAAPVARGTACQQQQH